MGEGLPNQEYVPASATVVDNGVRSAACSCSFKAALACAGDLSSERALRIDTPCLIHKTLYEGPNELQKEPPKRSRDDVLFRAHPEHSAAVTPIRL